MNRWIVIVFLILAGCGKGEGPSGEYEEHGTHEQSHEKHAEKTPPEVRLSKEYQQLIGLELVRIEKELAVELVEVVGQIAQETEQVVHVSSPQDGFLQSFLVGLGEDVDVETPLCVIQTKTGEAFTIASTSHGTVLAQYLKAGDRVDSLTSIITIANPDLLRAGFDVYERDIGKIALGQKVSVQSIAYPEKEFQGEIVFISPRVDVDTRTIKVRGNIANEEHLLKFGMFVTGKISVPMAEERLMIPNEAIQTLENKPVVFIPETESKDEFIPQAVQIGKTVGEKTEILKGLNSGDRVVSKGSFYLKSELLKGQFGDGHNH